MEYTEEEGLKILLEFQLFLKKYGKYYKEIPGAYEYIKQQFFVDISYGKPNDIIRSIIEELGLNRFLENDYYKNFIEYMKSETGIDIHPAAKIGTHFTIDHGTGVVIGATSIIGNNVKLYQGVTLGAKSFPLDADGKPIKGIPRHPILEDNVIVYSNATILGRITIGRDATVGGNIWVTENVPAGARIVQTKAKK